MDAPITLSPIGYVESEFDSHASSEDMAKRPSRIIVQPELEPGLMGLEPGQEILVLFYFHSVEGYELRLHPRHDPKRPLRGVFATRTQYRPNAIGATVVHIESISRNVIRVTGLDARDGTPVLDIKPYRAEFDSAPSK